MIGVAFALEKATLVLRRDHEERVVSRGIHGAPNAGNAIAVQIGRDGARRFPHRELPEDTADNRGLGFIDLAFAPNRLALTIGTLHHLVARRTLCPSPPVPSDHDGSRRRGPSEAAHSSCF